MLRAEILLNPRAEPCGGAEGLSGERAYAERDERFGNGRAVSNLFDDVIAEQASRLVGAGLQDERNALIVIEPEDFDGSSS